MTTQISWSAFALKTINTNDKKLNSRILPYRNLVFIALCYGALTFVCAVGIGPNSARIGVPVIIATSLSTIVLVAIWSVLGPGSYLTRLIGSHLVGTIVLVGFWLGLILSSEARLDLTDESTLFLLVATLIAIPPISVAAQIPFWFFRGFFGWQFVFRGNKPDRAYSLRDIFVLTFVFALGFASPQAIMYVQPKKFERFSPAVETVEVTQAMMAAYIQFLGFAIVIFFGALLSLPILLLVFRPLESLAGCVYSGIYCGAIALLLIVVGAFAFGGVGAGEFLFYLGGTLGLYGLGLAIPLVTTRAQRFRLTSPKRFEKEQRLI